MAELVKVTHTESDFITAFSTVLVFVASPSSSSIPSSPVSGFHVMCVHTCYPQGPLLALLPPPMTPFLIFVLLLILSLLCEKMGSLQGKRYEASFIFL